MSTRQKLFLIAGITLLFGLIFTQEGVAQDELREGKFTVSRRYVPREIIVKFKPRVKENEIAKINLRHGTSAFYTSPFARFRRLRIPPGKTVAEMVKTYKKEAGVEYAEANYIAYALMTPNDPYYSYQWHLDNTEYGGIAKR